MMKHLNFIYLLGLAGAFLLISAQDAHAYFDPGSVNFIVQILVAVVLTATVFLKSFWGKIRSLFQKNKEDHVEENK